MDLKVFCEIKLTSINDLLIGQNLPQHILVQRVSVGPIFFKHNLDTTQLFFPKCHQSNGVGHTLKSC